MSLTIRRIKVITTAPEGIDLVVVKVEHLSRDYMVWDVPLLRSDIKRSLR